MNKKKLTNFSEKLIDWIGSVQSLVIHTIFFSSIFILGFSGLVDSDRVFNITTNILSIEAIYLAIFIQMTVNKHSEDLEEVSEDIEDLQEDLGEIQKDVDEIQEDVGEIQKDVDEIQEDVEEISEDDAEESKEEEREDEEEREKFKQIEDTLQTLLREISELKRK